MFKSSISKTEHLDSLLDNQSWALQFMKKKIILISVLLLVISTLVIATLVIHGRSSLKTDATSKTHSTLKLSFSSKHPNKTKSTIFSFVDENSYCKDLDNPKCTLIDLGELYLRDPEKWRASFVKTSKEKCNQNDWEGCEFYATYLYDLKDYSESLKYFERACQLGEKESCCKAIWIKDRAIAKEQSVDDLSKMHTELEDEKCNSEYPDSIVFGVHDQIERNGDYKTNSDIYIGYLILSCSYGSSQGCYEAAKKMTTLGEPYVSTQTLYELACTEHEEGACEDIKKLENENKNIKPEIKGNPEYPIEGSYTLNMGVYNNTLKAKRKLILFETKGIWSAINELAEDKFMVIVGKFKSKKEAEEFISKEKFIKDTYKSISKFD